MDQTLPLIRLLKSVDFRVYSRNNAISEVFFDSYSKQTSLSNAAVYATQVNQLGVQSTPSLQLVPGLEPTGNTNVFGLNVPANKFFNSAVEQMVH